MASDQFICQQVELILIPEISNLPALVRKFLLRQ
ncbi:hypothetical protein PMIT1312_00553 [Prochlorococcus marinus str. MIT 1312]|nr:hypothetical protein PMIT1312_00553 [Prochlorococcus marinus str. MIT 1312]